MIFGFWIMVVAWPVQGADRTGEIAPPAPPAIVEMSEDADGPSNAFDRGLAHYLRQEYKEAIQELTLAVESGLETQKAERILKRSYEEMIRIQRSGGDLESAELYRSRAQKAFPREAPFAVSTIAPSKFLQRAAKSDVVKKSQPSRSADQQGYSALKSFQKSPAPAALIMAPLQAKTPAASQQDPNLGLTRREMVAAVLLIMIAIVGGAVAVNWRMRRFMERQTKSSQMALEAQASHLEEAVKKLQAEKGRLLNDVLARQEVQGPPTAKLAGAPAAAEVPPPAAVQNDRKRIEAQARRLETQARRELKSVPTAKLKSVSDEERTPSTKENKKIIAVEVKLQKKQILESLIHISPEERPQLQARIASQAKALCQSSASEGIKFLRQLSQDKSPMVRVMVVPALCQVRLPAAWDLVFDLARDGDGDVRAQVFKTFKSVAREAGMEPAALKRVQDFFEEEKNKAEWIF
ncbi:MAG: HEAT repeat domain-containing protein [Elusimicrobia bacterium]|nr:HEAT repeat domain-containing protein [Elusimicrobiota bacterium]